MISTPISLIKVGGSLLDWPELPARLTHFVQERRRNEPDVRPVLMCGGGAFVDTVRRLDRVHHLGDAVAHRMAIQAMSVAAGILLFALPDSVVVDRETTGAEVMRDARAALPYGLPTVPHLDLAAMGDVHYAYAPPEPGAPAGAARRRLLAYLRVPGRVRFFLDPAVYHDTARALLPEIGAYAAGLVNHLFRAEIRLEVANGAVAVSVAGARGEVRKGAVRVYADDASGKRRAIGAVPASATPQSLTIPAGTRRIAAVLRGEDDAGELVAVSERAAP